MDQDRWRNVDHIYLFSISRWHPDEEGSRKHTKYKCIGEQVIHLRWIMTSMFWGIYVQILHYSFRIGNVPERDSERSEESIFLFFLGSLSSNRKMREPFQMKGV